MTLLRRVTDFTWIDPCEIQAAFVEFDDEENCYGMMVILRGRKQTFWFPLYDSGGDRIEEEDLAGRVGADLLKAYTI